LKNPEILTEFVEAAVAVILREDGRVLLGQRPEGKSWAGWWEFPGGKVEAGETASHALRREVHEELGIDATAFTPWITREFTYPERHVKLNFFTVRAWNGTPHGKENQQLSWEDPAAVQVGPLLPANEPVLKALCLPTVYGITNLAEMGETDFSAALDRALENGLRLIQVREKQLPTDKSAAFARQVIDKAHAHGARVVVNGDVELARACGADGVHLSSAALKSLVQKPDDWLCGASCHSAEELALAAKFNLDYVLLAPVQSTLTHPGTAPIGWDGFASLIRGMPMPVYALGGMARADLPVSWQHGAHGIAMLREAWK
jgi:8-oxo-dGTP diphosphatase